jgi:hypothetical protein
MSFEATRRPITSEKVPTLGMFSFAIKCDRMVQHLDLDDTFELLVMAQYKILLDGDMETVEFI